MKEQTLLLTFSLLLVSNTLNSGIFSPEEIKAFGLTRNMLPKESTTLAKPAIQKVLPLAPRARPARGASRSKIVHHTKKIAPQQKIKKIITAPTIRIKPQDQKKLLKWIEFYTKKLNLYKRWAERASSEARLKRYSEKIERTQKILEQLEMQRK